MRIDADRAAQERAAIEIHTRQAQQFAEAYARKAQDPYSSCFAYSRHRLDEFLRRLLPGGRPDLVLDVGCGTGYHMAALRARGYRVSGIDGSEDMLAEARRLNPGADLRLARVDELPFPDASFDVVLSIEVLRYLPDPRPMLRECARVLRPGGVLGATAAPRLNLNGYWIVNRLAAAVPIPGLVRLKQYFTTSRALRLRLGEAGFHGIEVHGVYWGPINWIERVARPLLKPALRGWEPLDRRIADRPWLRELANMFVVRAVKP